MHPSHKRSPSVLARTRLPPSTVASACVAGGAASSAQCELATAWARLLASSAPAGAVLRRRASDHPCSLASIRKIGACSSVMNVSRPGRSALEDGRWSRRPVRTFDPVGGQQGRDLVPDCVERRRPVVATQGDRTELQHHADLDRRPVRGECVCQIVATKDPLPAGRCGRIGASRRDAPPQQEVLLSLDRGRRELRVHAGVQLLRVDWR